MKSGWRKYGLLLMAMLFMLITVGDTLPSPPTSPGINGTWRIDSGTYTGIWKDSSRGDISLPYKQNSAKASEFEIEVRESYDGQGYDIILSGYGVFGSGFPGIVFFEWEDISGGTHLGEMGGSLGFKEKTKNVYSSVWDEPELSRHSEKEYSLVDDSTLQYRLHIDDERDGLQVEVKLSLKRVK